MTIWQRLKGSPARLPAEARIKLRAGRFHRILENQKRFHDLIQDAVEKLGGAFVIDNQYLMGLVDRAFALAADIMCDMNVMQDSPQYYDKYFKLDRMKSDLRRIIAWQPCLETGRLIIPLNEIDELDHYHQAGGVFTRLAEVRQRLGLLVPEGFVISFAAFNLFIQYNGLESLLAMAETSKSLAMAQLRDRILGAGIPPELRAQVETAVAQMRETCEPPLEFIVNGAAMGEEYNRSPDGGCTAMAANVPEVFDAYRFIAAAMFSESAIADRVSRGMNPQGLIAVAVSRKIPSLLNGTIQTVNPDAPHPGLIRVRVAAASGTFDVELSRSAPFRIASGSQEAAGLTPEDLAALAEKAMRIERFFKCPQHIEWALDKHRDAFIIRTSALALDPSKSISPEVLAQAVSRHETLYEHAGATVSSGIASGAAHVAQTEQDLDSMPEHGVLVIRDLDPCVGLLRALQKAAAILTDRGTPAGHVASLAREFHVPAIMGLGDVTTRVAAGDVVTVDADDNVVYRGAVEELLNYQLWEYLDLDSAREYSLLRFALHRLAAGSISGSRVRRTRLESRETLDDVVRFCLDAACRSMTEAAQSVRRGKTVLHLANGQGANIALIDLGDALDAPTAAVSPDEIHSKPLSAFFDGLASSGLSRFAHGATGLVMVSRERLFLNLSVGPRTYVLDAFLCGELEHDYFYLRASDVSSSGPRTRRQVLWLQGILNRCGIMNYTMNDGFTAWKYNLPAVQMEQMLRMLGAMLGHAESSQNPEASGISVAGEIDRFLDSHRNDPAAALQQ